MAQSQPIMRPTKHYPTDHTFVLATDKADAVEEVLEVEGIISLPYDTWGS
jgi:hypothetical protein